MKKRILSICMAIIITASLTACDNSKKTINNDSNSKSPTGTVTKSPSQDEGEEITEVDLYGYDEPVTIKVGYGLSGMEFYGGETIEDNSWVDLYKENNILLDILYNVDGSQAAMKLSTGIMSGNYPDIIYTNSSDYVNYANGGVIADITELLDEYASDELKEYLNADGGLALDCLTVDGKLYGLPKMSSSYDKVSLMFIRKDWLDNLGLSVPTTMEELREVAHAFTYNDPDGNGKNDTYGLAIAGVDVVTGGQGDASAIFDGFGAHIGNNAMAIIKGEDGKVTWGGTNVEGMKKGLSFLNGLYEDGSLAKDFITMTSANVNEDASAGRCGIWIGPMWAAMEPQFASLKSDPNSHIICIQVPDGLGQGDSKSFLPVAFDGVFAVSSKCENPEVLIKLMNLSVRYLCHYANSEEYYRYYGDYENYTGWKLSITDTLEPLKNYLCYQKMTKALQSRDTSELNPYELDIYNSLVVFGDAVKAGTFDPADDSFAGPVGRYTVYGDPQGAYAVIDKMVQSDSFVNSAYDAPLTDEQAEVSGTLKKMTVETIVKIVTGTESINYYDTFLKSWMANGGQRYIEDAQAWVDANK